MVNREARNGDEVRCKISGFVGVVVSYATHLSGCDRLFVEPAVGDDNKPGDGRWLDVHMVEIVTPDKVQAYGDTAPAIPIEAPGGRELPPSR